MRQSSKLIWSLCFVAAVGCRSLSTKTAPQNPAVKEKDDVDTETYSAKLLKEGREVFRYETFGSEDFWGGQLRLHEAIADQKRGGLGEGITPKQALELGLKVDVGKLPGILYQAIRGRSVSLEEPKTTVELLKADAVVGVKGFFDDPQDRMKLTSIGIQCSLCHSTVNDSLTKGIGGRLDGWPNRDLDVGAIVGPGPDPQAFRRPAAGRRGHGAQGAEELGARTLRRRAEPGRQGVPARREDRRPPCCRRPSAWQA